MNNILTVTIGIPAHNEERNIANLLLDIKKQKSTSYVIQNIILVADHCTDKTIENATKTHLRNLGVKEFQKRQGKAHALDYIVKHTTSDVLILFDADTRLKSDTLLEQMVRPIISKHADIVSIKVKTERTRKFINSVLYTSNEFKHALYEGWNKGNNIYTCHGRAIAMTQQLYSQLTYKTIIADDAFAYLSAKKLNLSYQYLKGVAVFYKLPQTLKDHSKQSSRFLQSQKQLKSHFNEQFVEKEYAIPKTVLLKNSILFFFKKPLEMSLFVLIFSYLKLKNIQQTRILPFWDIAHTSKK